jgi:hypothetical protein
LPLPQGQAPAAAEKRLIKALETVGRAFRKTYFYKPAAASAAYRRELLSRPPDDPERQHFETMQLAHSKYMQYRETRTLPPDLLPPVDDAATGNTAASPPKQPAAANRAQPPSPPPASSSSSSSSSSNGPDASWADNNSNTYHRRPDITSLTPEQRQQLSNEFQREYYYGERGAQRRALRQLGLGTPAQLRHFALAKKAFAAVQGVQKRARRGRDSLRAAHDRFEREYLGEANAVKRARLEAAVAQTERRGRAEGGRGGRLGNTGGGGGGGVGGRGLTGSKRLERERFVRLRAAYDEWEAKVARGEVPDATGVHGPQTPAEQQAALVRAGYNEYRRLKLHLVKKREAWLKDDKTGAKQRRFEELRVLYNEYMKQHQQRKRQAKKEEKERRQKEGGPVEEEEEWIDGSEGLGLGSYAEEGWDHGDAISGAAGVDEALKKKARDATGDGPGMSGLKTREKDSHTTLGSSERLMQPMTLQATSAMDDLSSGTAAAVDHLRHPGRTLIQFGLGAAFASVFHRPHHTASFSPSLPPASRAFSAFSGGLKMPLHP